MHETARVAYHFAYYGLAWSVVRADDGESSNSSPVDEAKEAILKRAGSDFAFPFPGVVELRVGVEEQPGYTIEGGRRQVRL